MTVFDYTRALADVPWIQYSPDTGSGMRCYYPTGGRRHSKWRCLFRIPEGGQRNTPFDFDARKDDTSREFTRFFEIADELRARGWCIFNLETIPGGQEDTWRELSESNVAPAGATIAAQAMQWARDHAKEFPSELDTEAMVGLGNSAGALLWLLNILRPEDQEQIPSLPELGATRRKLVPRSHGRPDAVIAINPPIDFVAGDPLVMKEIANGMVWQAEEFDRTVSDPNGFGYDATLGDYPVGVKGVWSMASPLHHLAQNHHQNIGAKVYFSFEGPPAVRVEPATFVLGEQITGVDGIDDSSLALVTEKLAGEAKLDFKLRWGTQSENLATPALSGAELAKEVANWLDERF
ncbi:MAG: hypothetical protein B7733_06300 [Myxococcales bacterium FL481]|nr:MAG: hypothetical protein B7733_06300 [Myxococcales bacterium FL481]